MTALRIKILSRSGAALPEYATASAAGMDLRSDEDCEIAPGDVRAVKTGLFIELPDGFEAQIRSRSGLALKHRVAVLNAPGTIDADYRGELQVILVNHGSGPFRICRGDRIAQMVVAPVTRVVWEPAAELCPSARGEGGLGSTGIK